MTLFTPKALKTDITALQFNNNFLFAGIGGYLNVYDPMSNDLINQKIIFEGQKIYGIKFNSKNSQLIIYGGRNIAIISINSSYEHEFEIIVTNKLSEWILDASWINNDAQIAVINMGNRVIIRSVNLNTCENELLAKCEDNCILYSALLFGSSFKELLVFAGTIFNQILLWKPSYTNQNKECPVLKRLKKHNGVILGMHYNKNTGYLCTVSDDRSAVLWQVNQPNLDNLRPDNLDDYEFIVKCHVYQHSARIFRCLVTSNYFLTAGEDSLLIAWDFESRILRKIDTHQGCCAIWSLVYDECKDIVYIGRNDGGISSFKIDAAVANETITLKEQNDSPKLVALTYDDNIICFSEKACLYCFNRIYKRWTFLGTYHDLKPYCILEISPCRKLIALAGFNGQIYISKQLKHICKYTLQKHQRIYSFHWINCKMFLVCQDYGELHLCVLQNHKINNVHTFILPPNKERWSTCATILNNHIIVGDRKGNIHNYRIGEKLPINTLKKIHSYLGVTNIYSRTDKVISLGRNGIFKTYKLIGDFLECVNTKKIKYNWLTTVIDFKYILSFSGEKFVISEYKSLRVLFESFCGGGHRSWHYALDNSNNFTFSFIKQKSLNTVRICLNDFMPQDLIQSYHVKEINCIKIINFKDNLVLISGGEDTTLRFATLHSDSSLNNLATLKVHLSSIRCLCVVKLTVPDEYLIFSGGGRAQIIYWHIVIEQSNELILMNSTIKYNLYEALNKSVEIETRIMDLSAMKMNDQYFLAAGGSDGVIKLFSVTTNKLSFMQRICHHSGCITKLMNLKLVGEQILISMATDGYVKFWKITKDIHNLISSLKIHQSGISACSCKLITKNCALLLTGGDDSLFKVTLFKFNKRETITNPVVLFESEQIHCAQISGVIITNEYLLTSSIDQKIVLYKWTLENDSFNCNVISSYISAIADQKGIEHIMTDNLNLFIYGNGIEHLVIDG